MLQGASLSRVQEFAVEIIYFMDGQEKNKREVDEMRRTLLGSRLREPQDLYPEYFTDEDASDVPASNDVVYDYSAVKWESPRDKGIAEFERLQSQMSMHQYVTLVGDDDEGEQGINTQGFVSAGAEWI